MPVSINYRTPNLAKSYELRSSLTNRCGRHPPHCTEVVNEQIYTIFYPKTEPAQLGLIGCMLYNINDDALST